MTTLRLADAESRADLAAYVGRARALDDQGAIRLQADGMALAAYVGVLPGSGLMGQGAVTGLRTLLLAEPASLDTTVALGALADRLARPVTLVGDGHRLEVPPVTVHVGWAAVAPPRTGWEPGGQVASALLEDVAREGIAEVAQGSSTQSGAHAVSALRDAVWSRTIDGLGAAGLAPGVRPPAGAAFAAYVLGFLRSGTDASVFANGRWLRLSTPSGHVLVR